ncbi:MAG: serine/threonine protein kinase [Deltaproteobacteria bacterium]|nr:serine/threonine protein kinase [Deltaproteobacteria bacterium]
MHLRKIRGVRFFWLYLLLWPLSFVIWGNGVSTALHTRTLVSPGFALNLRGRAVSPTEDVQKLGIHHLDFIEKVDGFDVPRVESGRIPDAHWIKHQFQRKGLGAEVEIVTRHPSSSEPLTTRLTLQPLSTDWDFFMDMARLACAATFFLAGLILFWFHPGRTISWTFIGLTYSTASAMALGGDFIAQEPTTLRFGIAIESSLGIVGLLFFLSFPSKMPWLHGRARVVQLVLILAFALSATTFVGYPEFPFGLYAIAVGSYCNAATVVFALGLIGWRTRRIHPPREAAQLRLLLLALAVGFGPPALWSVLKNFFLEVATFRTFFIEGPFTVFVLLIAYAIVKHDLVNLDRMTVQAAAYTGAILAIGAGFVASILFSIAVLPEEVSKSPFAVAGCSISALLLLRPLKSRLERFLERRFSHLRVDPADKVSAVREVLRVLMTGPTAEVFDDVERILSTTFGFSTVAVLVPAQDGWCRARERGRTTGSTEGKSRAQLSLDRIFPIEVDGTTVGGLGIGGLGAQALSKDDEAAIGLVLEQTGKTLQGALTRPSIGGYQIVRLLGTGGMGSVWLGEKEGVGGFIKRAAVKQLLTKRATHMEGVTHFLREARLAAQLSHPNIVETYDLGETEDGYFIAMEYVAGIDANRLIRRLSERGTQLELTCAAYIAASLCRALDYAHRQATDANGDRLRLIHRDATPHNVLLSTDGHVKLTDFGVALMQKDAQANDSTGKASYLAPEQLRGERIDHRADLFVAGIVLYELCTSSHPFRNPGRPAATWRAIAASRYLPLQVARPDCPSALAQVVSRALASTPADRFAHGGDMADAIEDAVPKAHRSAEQVSAWVRKIASLDEDFVRTLDVSKERSTREEASVTAANPAADSTIAFAGPDETTRTKADRAR